MSSPDLPDLDRWSSDHPPGAPLGSPADGFGRITSEVLRPKMRDVNPGE